jgi:GTP-binding protein
VKIRSAEFIKSAVSASGFLDDGRPELVFAGRSNVGKSSLINKMLNRKGLAKTSGTPGRTRMINYFLINDRFYLVDLPGYGYAKASKTERQKWAEFIGEYLRQRAPDLHIVLLIDGKISGSPLDRDAVEYLLSLGAHLTLAVTKIDRVPRSQRPRRLKQVREFLELPGDVAVIPVSAKSGDGIPELWKAVAPGA